MLGECDVAIDLPRLARVIGVPLRFLTGSVGSPEFEMAAWSRTDSRMKRDMDRTVWGAKAPTRKRKKRLAKKLAKRDGYLHYASLGARLGLAVSFCVEVSP